MKFFKKGTSMRACMHEYWMPIKLYLQKQAVGHAALRPCFPSGPLSGELYYSHQIKAADFGILSAPSLGVYFQLIKSRFWVDVSLQNALGLSRLISACQGLVQCFASI